MSSSADVCISLNFPGGRERVSSFLKIIGLEMKNGIVEIPSVMLCVSDEQDGSGEIDFPSEISCVVDKGIDEIERDLRSKGFRVISSGFDISGPFVLAEGPAGIEVKIFVSQNAFSDMLKNSSKK